MFQKISINMNGNFRRSKRSKVPNHFETQFDIISNKLVCLTSLNFFYPILIFIINVIALIMSYVQSFLKILDQPNVIKLLTVVIYELSKQARVFVLVKLFQLRQMFVGKNKS
jgi:hypothetical protein